MPRTQNPHARAEHTPDVHGIDGACLLVLLRVAQSLPEDVEARLQTDTAADTAPAKATESNTDTDTEKCTCVRARFVMYRRAGTPTRTVCVSHRSVSLTQMCNRFTPKAEI